MQHTCSQSTIKATKYLGSRARKYQQHDLEIIGRGLAPWKLFVPTFRWSARAYSSGGEVADSWSLRIGVG
jgi:hypothetical protein